MAAASAAAAPPLVLVINSYHPSFPWVRLHNSALAKSLGPSVDIRYFHMDTKRLPQQQFQERAELAYEKYQELKPDVVVLTDDNAAQYLGRRITTSGTPVVYLGINGNPRNIFEVGDNATGVLERPLMKRSVLFMQDILPNGLDKCLILFDSGVTAQTVLDTIFRGRTSTRFGHINADIRLVQKYSEWKQLVLSAEKNGYDAIFLGLYQTITDGEQHVPDEDIARWTSANSTVPVFCFWDFAVGKDKAIGGLVLAGEPQGQVAATFVRRILAGETAATLEPAIAEHGHFLFSYHELDRWNITLPPSLPTRYDSLYFVE